MNLQRRVARLNQRFGDKFGYVETPDGNQPRYAWKNTDEIHFFVDEGYQHTPGGLVLPQRKYVRRPWSTQFGRTWVVCQWRPPEFTRQQWLDQIQDQFPYPANGRYVPIDNTQLAPGDEPDENITAYVIGRLWEQKEASFAELLDASTTAVQKDRKATDERFGDQVDDWWPAFDKVEPGSHGEHVEFQAGFGESRRFGGLHVTDH